MLDIVFSHGWEPVPIHRIRMNTRNKYFKFFLKWKYFIVFYLLLLPYFWLQRFAEVGCRGCIFTPWQNKGGWIHLLRYTPPTPLYTPLMTPHKQPRIVSKVTTLLLSVLQPPSSYQPPQFYLEGLSNFQVRFAQPPGKNLCVPLCLNKYCSCFHTFFYTSGYAPRGL